MIAKDNHVYTAAMQFGKSFSELIPETVIYGYAKLLSLDETQICNFVPDDSMDDLQIAREWFSDNKLDLNLIKSGLLLIVPLIPHEEAIEKQTDFRNFLDNEDEFTWSDDILDEALETSFVPLKSIFKIGNDLDSVFTYKEDLKKKNQNAHKDNKDNDESDTDGFKETLIRLKEKIEAEKRMMKSEPKEIGESSFNGEDPSGLEATKWNGYQLDMLNFLKNRNLETKQIDSIAARVKRFAESLIGTEYEATLEDLYISLSEIKGWKDLKQAYSDYKEKDSHENLAKYKEAGHKYVRNLLQCIESYRIKCAPPRDRLMFLSEKYSNAYQSLTEKVIGQDYAVNEFIHACFDAEMYKNDTKHPEAVFLFAGPPGVGKTFLAQNVAEILGRPFKTFDMTSYTTEKSDIVLIGVEPGFRNSHEGTLVGFVEDNPDAIILFDEIEKAHPDVIRLFLSVLDGARIENKLLSSNTDFSNTILIFTTNAGRSIYEDNKRNLSATPTDVIINELRKEKSNDGNQPKFPPELCSRFASQHIIMFNHIGISDMVKLIIMHMDEACNGIEEKLNISIEYDRRLPLLLLMHYGNIDVRVITGQAKQFIRKEIYELSRQLARAKGVSAIRKISFSIDDTRISEKAKQFFNAAENEEALIAVVCDKKTRKKLEAIQTERIRFQFVESEEKLSECDPEEVIAFFVDPYYEMRMVDNRILGLDDYDSVGLRIIKSLLQKNIPAPVFMLENSRKVSQTDRNTMYMRGVEDTICLDDGDLSKKISEIVEEHILQEKCMALINRRKVFDFESLQEMPDQDGAVSIRFYDISVKDAVNPDDQDLLIDIEERPNVRFDDVIGAENAKAELKDFVKYLETPKAYMQQALSVPKGILLYGPPGTGKTMLAKAMAGETDATFISVSAAKLRSSGEDSIERLFRTARKYAPAIIFIDEVDAIAHKRTGSPITAYEESLLNMLLTQMDGFEQHKDAPVFVIAATNFGVEVTDDPMDGGLDPAFMRRFGNKILIDQPNKDEKTEFLTRKLAGDSGLKNNVTGDGIRNIAERTPGESLANLQNILELAFRNAARKGHILDDEILDEAMEEYYYGEKKSPDEEQLYRTAIHEASHAYIYSLSGKKPTYLTIVSRGGFGGYMQREDEENKSTISKEECIWSIRTCLAGRVGERVIFGDEASLNSGASSDLRNASSMAMKMLISYGMYEEHLFSISYDNLLKSDLMPVYVERAEEILNKQEEECHELIKKGKDKIIAVAKALLEKSHLNQEELAEMFREELLSEKTKNR